MNLVDNDIERNEFFLTNSLLSKDKDKPNKVIKSYYDPIDLANNHKLQRVIRLLVFLGVLGGLMIGKIWMIVI